MKTLTYHPKYGEVREDGLTVLRDVEPKLAEEIVRSLNYTRANPQKLHEADNIAAFLRENFGAISSSADQ